tara:strand:- start:36 stop:209 length:174 start_codon:yes stop_codon:yes gene_type:complete
MSPKLSYSDCLDNTFIEADVGLWIKKTARQKSDGKKMFFEKMDRVKRLELSTVPLAR